MITREKEDLSDRSSDSRSADKAILPPSLPRRRRSRANLKGDYDDNELQDLSSSCHTAKISVSSQPVTSMNVLSNHSPKSIAFTEPLRRSVGESVRGRLDRFSLDMPPTPVVLTEARIRCHLSDFIEDIDSLKGRGTEDAWKLLFDKYISDDYVLVRPSGNPAERNYMVKLWTVDIQLVSRKLVSIDNIQMLAGGKVAVVLYTADHIFLYKGTYNEDRAVLSCVMELQGDAVKIVHEHRTRGIPIPKETRWSSSEN